MAKPPLRKPNPKFGVALLQISSTDSLKGKFAYACWGSEKGSNKLATSQLPKALKAKGATVIGSEMAGTGHAFAVTEHPKVAEWLTNVAFATPAKK